jgi:hypothetical protein
MHGIMEIAPSKMSFSAVCKLTTRCDEASAGEVLETVRSAPSRPSVILVVWRQVSNISPGGFVTKFEQDLSMGREVQYREVVAYSRP